MPEISKEGITPDGQMNPVGVLGVNLAIAQELGLIGEVSK